MPLYKSNLTGLRIAEEVIGSLKVLPGTPVWHPQQPNSYGDFGSETKTEARSFIASDRQRRTGNVVDVDASGSFVTDFTTTALVSTMQGFMCADWRKKAELVPSAVAAGAYTVAASGTTFLVNSLVFGQGYTTAGNNGVKLVTASTATSVTAAGLAVEATATGLITRVGHQGASGDLTLTVTTGIATLGATALNLTTLGLIPGEWVWLGGDAAGERFNTVANNGFYRIKTIAASAIVFDRAPDGVATDAGAAKTIRIFMGNAIKNESDPLLQKYRTYQLERTFDSTTIEYVVGAAANKLSIDGKSSTKLTAELEFVGLDTETPGAPKSGTRPNTPLQAAFSSATDFIRLRLTNDTSGLPLAVYLTDLKLSIDNGVEPDKAIGYIGGIDHSVGDFMVSGSVEAFFDGMAAVTAVRNHAIVALDFGLVTNVFTPGVGNQAAGWLFDVPQIELGDGRLKVEKDKKVKLPLNLEASASDTYNHSLLAVHYPYLPQLAT
jgi:hypothetical protein